MKFNQKGFTSLEVILLVFLLIVIVVGFSIFSTVVGTYNHLATDKQTTLTAQGNLDAQLQRRFDLINQTVGATKGALSHETTIFADIAKEQAAFTQAQNSGNTQGQLSASTAVSASVGQALRGYLVVAQQYPQEYALQEVQNLQTDIDGSENRVSNARQFYNSTAQQYNTELSTFPNNWLNGSYFHFQSFPYYQNTAQSSNAPTVNLGQ